jgi:GNAT superfamily N-acetyltransferase
VELGLPGSRGSVGLVAILHRGALRYPWVWISGDYAAASVWIPPNGVELTEEEEEGVEPLVRDLIGPRCDDVMELLDRFDASHPSAEPHYYLSLLGTHPSCRGGGIGMALLADNLRRTDAEGMPVFLESSNPANNSRYERLGFRQVGEFTTPDETRKVATMWREAEAKPTIGEAMSQENIAAVEDAYRALASGGLDRFLALDRRSRSSLDRGCPG